MFFLSTDIISDIVFSVKTDYGSICVRCDIAVSRVHHPVENITTSAAVFTPHTFNVKLVEGSVWKVSALRDDFTSVKLKKKYTCIYTVYTSHRHIYVGPIDINLHQFDSKRSELYSC